MTIINYPMNNMKTLMKLLLYIILISLIALSSCDIIEAPYTEEGNKPPVDTSKYVRNVLLEDYTGHRCGNCPRAAKLAATLSEHYGDRLIVMAVHAGYYAKPKGDKYSYDFRTDESNAYDEFFGISKVGNPNGMVSRIDYPTGHIKSEGKWDAAIQELLALKPRMSLELEGSLDTNKMEISVTYKIKYLQDGSPNDNLVLLILEDSVIKYQTDYSKNPPDIPDYVHMHVLRASFTGPWGTALNPEGIAKDDVFENTLTYKIPADKDWVPKNLSVIAYIHDNGDTYEVYQVQKAHLKLK